MAIKTSSEMSTSPGTDFRPVVQRTIKPVKWWAMAGCAYLAAGSYSVTRWLLGGQAHSIGTGADPVPTYMTVGIRAHEVLYTLIAIVAVYYAIYRPWKRQGRLTLDGLALIAITTIWFQDPLINYGKQVFTYNSGFLNVGCPQCYMPGWMGRQEGFATSPFWSLAFFIGAAWFACKAGMIAMRWIMARWPGMGYAGAFAVLSIPLLVGDFITEASWIRLGLYGFPGAYGGPKWLTLWRGHFYQLPIWEMALAVLWYAGVTLAWLVRDDKGHVIAERGIDRVRGTEKRRTGLRLLALIGLFNLIILCVYSLPMAVLSMRWSDWPADFENRSYFNHGACGPGTRYACPDPSLPAYIEGSAAVTPEGQLAGPDVPPASSPNSPSVKLAAFFVMVGVFALGLWYIWWSDRSHRPDRLSGRYAPLTRDV